MLLWRKSIDKMRRKTRFGRQVSWFLVPAEDPDEAFASLRDQGLYIEQISIPLRANDSAAGDCSNILRWPRSAQGGGFKTENQLFGAGVVAQSVSRSLPGPPIRFVIISDTHSQHERMNQVLLPLLHLFSLLVD
jgi:hypothetical protein